MHTLQISNDTYLLFYFREGDSWTVSLQFKGRNPCFKKTYHPNPKDLDFDPKEKAMEVYNAVSHRQWDKIDNLLKFMREIAKIEKKKK